MAIKPSRLATTGSFVMIASVSLLLAACGGGGSSTTSTTTPTTLSATPPAQDPVTGLRGACASLKNGSAGYDVGYCLSAYQGGTFAEGVAQNGPSSVSEASANVYRLAMPVAWAPSSPITLQSTGADTKVSSNQLGAVLGGYGLDRTTAADSTSLIDLSMSGAWGGTRLVNFGLWGYSKLSNELFYSGFAGPTSGVSAAPASVTGAGLTMTGIGATWYLYNNSTSVIPTGVAYQMALSTVSSMTVTGTTVSGTLSAFKVNTTSGVTAVAISDLAFTATLTPSTGVFSGTITSGGSGIVKGTIYADATGTTVQAAGQFAGKASDGRVVTGAFGVKK